MRDLGILFIHLLTTVVKLMGPGSSRAVIAESLLVKHQLVILNRGRERAPNLRPMDRVVAGLCILLVRSARFTRRIVGFAVHSGALDGPAVYRLFGRIVAGTGSPQYLSSDNDPLFRYRQWKANLRILDIAETKTVPHVPMSHPFIERLIGTVRREFTDQTPFWNTSDLEKKLNGFTVYYNSARVHHSLGGATPQSQSGKSSRKPVRLDDYRWQSHCRGLYELPAAA